MKRILLLMILAMPGLVRAQDVKEQPYLTKTLGETVKEVEMKTSGGSLSVQAAGTSEARLEVYIRGNNGRDELSKEEIKQRLEELYDLTITIANGKLTAIAHPKKDFSDWKHGLSISFRAYVPKNVSTELQTSGGSISLSGISGKQDFSTSGGSLHVDDVSGNIHGRTSGGSIHVSNSSDDIDLSTSGGSITAKECNGRIRLSTSGGSLNLNDLKGDIRSTTSGGGIKGSNISGELIAHTSGGGIRLDNLACSLETSTSGGSIDVSVASLGKYIRISNSGGNIDLEIPKGKGVDLEVSGDKIKTDQLTNFTGKADDDQIKGKMNGGGVPVEVRSGSGRVYLAFK